MTNQSSLPNKTPIGAICETKGPQADDSPSEPLFRLEERLLRDERKIADLLLRRSRLLADITARKTRQGNRGASGRPPNQALEKALWSAWEDVLPPTEAGRFRYWRQLVSQCNNLGYILGEQDQAQKAARTGTAWLLRPVPTRESVALSGPTDIFSAKTIIFWAALAGTPVQVRPVLLNEGLIELIKALNQSGARLNWEHDVVTHSPVTLEPPEPTRKTVHVGHDPFTLALLLASVLAHPGVFTFSGSGQLNMLSLKPWQQFLPQLGARLHQLNPHAPGLPVRLEASGRPEQAVVGSDVPQELIWALLAAAPFYPQGLRLIWENSNVSEPIGPELRTFARLYDLCGIPHRIQSDAITVSSAVPRFPSPPQSQRPQSTSGAVQLPLDPTLCAMLLTWSRITDRPMHLRGHWPGAGQFDDPRLNLLHCCGLRVKPGPDGVHAEPCAWPEKPVLDLDGKPGNLPLGLVLALTAPGQSVLGVVPAEYDQDAVDKLAQWSGRICRKTADTLTFHPDSQNTGRAHLEFEAPDALWALSLAMLSFKYPGAHLLNPGELTKHWPGFWHLYNHVLSTPRKRPENFSTTSSNKSGPRTASTGFNSPQESIDNVTKPSTPTRRRVKI
ncbi:hypothetical protein [Desulfonatronum thioautotrophicum]|uniref:hypothetical protein n=1 Tax=Desulfonatronum thioautotrophicum TaxID=617001 RepID=UPI0005EB0852|nr:hypothetical protein [Desulfonatronum thioautotrophicum]